MMKLGTQTGSLVNHMMSRNGFVLPKEGDGATLLGWTDRHAATVICVMMVNKKHTVSVQRDMAIRTDKNGMCESQEYEYKRDPSGQIVHFRWNDKTNSWVEIVHNEKTGRWNKAYSQSGVLFGERNEYYDFSF